MYFFDELTVDLSVNPNTYKRIIPVCADNLKSFTCSDRDELIRVGSSNKGFTYGIEQVCSHLWHKYSVFFIFSQIRWYLSPCFSHRTHTVAPYLEELLQIDPLRRTLYRWQVEAFLLLPLNNLSSQLTDASPFMG